MKTLTNLSIFSVLFFSVTAFASTGNSSPLMNVNDQADQTQSVQKNNQGQDKVTLVSAEKQQQSIDKKTQEKRVSSANTKFAQGQLTASSDKNCAKMLLISNKTTGGFNQSQQDRYRTTAARSDYQFASNKDSEQALASNQIASKASFEQTQHDFSQPSYLL